MPRTCNKSNPSGKNMLRMTGFGPTVRCMSPSPMRRVAVVGGGPGGLLFSALLARSTPEVEITLFERNRRTDAFGFGVVFSDATLRAIDEVDPVLRAALNETGKHWDRIEVWSHGQRHGFDGNGMSAIHRKELLARLQASAEQAGVEVRYAVEAPPLSQLKGAFDVVVGADGANSSVREQLAAEVDLGHSVETASAKFIWFATSRLFDGLTFVHRASEHGNFAAHAYPISDELSTFIVETDENTWSRAGLDDFDVTQPPGMSDETTKAYLERVFAADLEGARLVANNSRWANFRTRRSERWGHDNVIMLGDAVHTAHFSVGSGTKMAMEDAIELASQLREVAHGTKQLATALDDYVQNAKTPVAKVQSAAIPSLSWWEHFGLYQRCMDPLTFAFHFFSRSIGIGKLAQRDPQLASEVRRRWRSEHGADALDTPIEVADVTLGGRMLRLRVAGACAELRDDTDVAATLPLVHVPADAPTESVKSLAAALPSSGAVVIDGPPTLARSLLAQEARLRRNLLVVMAGWDVESESDAETLVLSGRADAVAVPDREASQ